MFLIITLAKEKMLDKNLEVPEAPGWHKTVKPLTLGFGSGPDLGVESHKGLCAQLGLPEILSLSQINKALKKKVHHYGS